MALFQRQTGEATGWRQSSWLGTDATLRCWIPIDVVSGQNDHGTNPFLFFFAVFKSTVDQGGLISLLAGIMGMASGFAASPAERQPNRVLILAARGRAN